MNRIVETLACLLIFCSVVRADCLSGTPSWQNTAISPRGGQFAVEFDATPSIANMNGIATLSRSVGSTFDDYAILVRFKEDGRIVVRNGATYTFDTEVFYTAGSSHHVRAVIDVPNHVYSIWVTTPLGPEVKIATNYAFRESQNTVERLDHWGVWSGKGTLQVCNFVTNYDCLSGSPVWQNTAISSRGGLFAVEFDATPSIANMNGIATLSLGVGSTFDDYAILVRFRGNGLIVVRNGETYGFDDEVRYTAGSSHHVRAQIDVPNHVYSVWVTPPSESEVKIATNYAFRGSQSTVESLDNWGVWSGSGSLEVCNFGITPMDPPGTLVTSAGLILDNAELLWIRSHDPMDSVEMILDDSVKSVQQYADRWLYFVTSKCLAWNEEATGCLASRMELGLTANVPYDLVAWTEAEDRRVPHRQMFLIAEDWVFQPADINIDGVIDCADLAWFSSNSYDWNLDGQVTSADLNDVAAGLSAALADLNGDGVVDSADLLVLLGNWGSCPPDEQCIGDLDCDGVIGMADFLLVIGLTGS